MPLKYSETGNLSKTSYQYSNFPPPPPPKKGKRIWWLFALGFLILVVGGVLFLRNGIGTSGSFNPEGNLEDNSFVTPTPVPFVEAKGCLPAVTGKQTLAQACVSDPAPRQYTVITLYTRLIVDGRVATQARMETKWNFKYFGNSCRNLGNTPDGVISCTLDIGNATKNYTVMLDVTMTNADGKVYTTTTSFTTEPETTVNTAAKPISTLVSTPVALEKTEQATPGSASTPLQATPNIGNELPCIALEKFSLTYGSYKDNLGKKACLIAIVDSAGARIPGGAVHISFKGYADIEGIIPADVRVRFDKSVIEKLHNQKIRLHGTFGLSSLIKVPVLTVELPEQIEVIS